MAPTESGLFVQPIGHIESCFRHVVGTPRQGSLAPATRARIPPGPCPPHLGQHSRPKRLNVLLCGGSGERCCLVSSSLVNSCTRLFKLNCLNQIGPESGWVGGRLFALGLCLCVCVCAHMWGCCVVLRRGFICHDSVALCYVTGVCWCLFAPFRSPTAAGMDRQHLRALAC